MTKDDPHSPEAAIAMAATLLRNAGQPERPEDQAEITLLSLRPGDRPREGLVVVPEIEAQETAE